MWVRDVKKQPGCSWNESLVDVDYRCPMFTVWVVNRETITFGIVGRFRFQNSRIEIVSEPLVQGNSKLEQQKIIEKP